MRINRHQRLKGEKEGKIVRIACKHEQFRTLINMKLKRVISLSHGAIFGVL
jgi:hypothetical protein